MILAIDFMDETNEVTEEAQHLVESILQFAARKENIEKTPSCLLHLLTMIGFGKSIKNIVIKIQLQMSFHLHLKKWEKMKWKLSGPKCPAC